MSSGNADVNRVVFFTESTSLKTDIKSDLSLELVRDNHLISIKEIHLLLKNAQNLTQQQKIAYCNSQRFHMKVFLKDMSRKLNCSNDFK